MPFLIGMITGASASLNVLDYGADNTGATNSNDAFRLASAAISAAGGGVLIIPPGTYTVGVQDFAGVDNLGYAYRSHKVCYITGCSRPTIVIAHGAVIKVAGGLRYGAFDPVTGEAYASTNPFSDADYKADYPVIFDIQNNTGGVTIVGPCEVDGNSSEAVVGGYYGDYGYQIPGTGLFIINTPRFRGEDIYTHDHPLDGVIYRSAASSFKDDHEKSSLRNIISLNNGRQGISITGACGLDIYNSKFSKTGRGAITTSAPRSGCDIEPLTGLVACYISFWNCEFSDNTAVQMFIDDVVEDTVRDISFTGCLFWSSDQYTASIEVPNVTFTACEFRGGGINYTYEAAADEYGTTKFIDCEFSDELYPDVAVDTGKTTYPVLNLNGGLFERCLFHNEHYTESSRRFIINSFYDKPHTYRDCIFANYNNETTNNLHIGFVRGATFEGRNVVKAYHSGENIYFIQTFDSAPAVYPGALVTDTAIRWGISYAAGISGDVGRHLGTRSGRYIELGTATGGTFARITAATTAPTSGQWHRGDVILNTGVAAGGQTSYWQCTTAGWLAAAWAGATAYGKNAVRKNGANFYVCTTGGTSAASGGPAGTGTSIADGTCVWDYVGSTTAVLTAHSL